MLFRIDRLLAGAGCALAALGSAGPALAQAGPSETRILSYPTPGVDLGAGWDSQGVQPKTSKCVSFVASQQPGSPQDVRHERTLVSDKYGYSNALNVSADVQVKSMTGAAVDVKATYANKKTFNSTYLNVVDLVYVDNGWTYTDAPKPGAALNSPLNSPLGAPLGATAPTALGRPPVDASDAVYFQAAVTAKSMRQRDAAIASGLERMIGQGAGGPAAASPAALMPLRGPAAPPPGAVLRDAPSITASVLLTPEALKLAQTNPDQFRAQCGDGFVAAINSGGEMAVTYTFMTTSQEEQQQIGASLNVSYGTPFTNVAASASVAQAIGSWGKTISTSIDFYRSGGSGEVIPTTLEQIDAQVQSFAAAVQRAPQPYKIMVMDYRRLANYPQGGIGMPSLSPFEKLAWEYGKANTLYTTVSQIISDLGDPQAKARYLTARWGSQAGALNNTQQAAGQRMTALQNVAKACMAASPSQAASVCQTTQFDDLSPRTDFPLPIGPGNVSDVVNGLWSDADAYRTVVFNRWINQVNQNRCWSHPADPTYCRYSSELAPLRQRINVAAPGYAALELVDQPGRCLNVGTITSYVSAQPCPSRPTDAGFFVKWDPVQQTLVSEEPNRCVYAMRTATTTPGFAIVGLAVCGATNNQEDISRTWTFRDSTDTGGRWDNTGAYLVVADRSTPSQLNSCLDSYSPTSTWVAPCTQPKRVRIWMAKPGT